MHQYQIGIDHRVPNVELRIASCICQDLGIPLHGRYGYKMKSRTKSRGPSLRVAVQLSPASRSARSARSARAAERAGRMCLPVGALVIGHWSSVTAGDSSVTGHRGLGAGAPRRGLQKSLRPAPVPTPASTSRSHSNKSLVPVRQRRVRGSGSAVGEECERGEGVSEGTSGGTSGGTSVRSGRVYEGGSDGWG
jgi:hypothetical protein